MYLRTSIFLCITFLCGPTWSGQTPWQDHRQDPEVDCKPDITDMIDYDPVTQTSARCERMKAARKTCDSDLAETKKQLEDCRIGRASMRGNCPTLPPPCDCKKQTGMEETCVNPARADDMFFFRLTRHLVSILQEKAPENGPVEAQVEVHLTSHEWKKLLNFAEGKEVYRKPDILDILVGMTIETFHFNQTSMLEWLGEQINFKSPGIVLALMSLMVVSVVFGVGMVSDLYWNRRFLGCLFLAVFVISLIWNWIFLFQEETIKRYRNAQKYESIPDNCLPHRMTWIQSLLEWYRTTWTVQADSCLEYHKIYLVDPLLDIPPSRALAFTISSFFVDPMKYAGRAFGEFHAELFRGLPMWAACLALISFYVIVFALVYAFIAAPRRVLREQPQPVAWRRREEKHRAVKVGRRRQLQLEEQRHDEADEEYGDHEGARVENVPHPPTLPPKDEEEEEQQELPEGWKKPATPRGKGAREIGAEPKTRSQQAMVKGDIPSNSPEGHHHTAEEGHQPTPRGLSPKNRSSDALLPKEQPAVRPKERHARLPPRWDDGEETDRSSLEPTGRQRPTRLPESSSTKTRNSPGQNLKRATSVGSTESGNLTAHPASERSDAESLVSSFADTTSLQEPEAMICSEGGLSGGTMTSTIECASPISADSPSDYSIISPSPENTNSATYEFISTSSIGLSESQLSSHTHAQQETQHGNDYGDDDDDDDFVVLKTETQKDCQT